MADRSEIKKIFDVYLSELNGMPDSIRYENTSSNTEDSEISLESFFIPGTKRFRELFSNKNPEDIGIYQVNVCSLSDLGSGVAYDMASLIESNFVVGSIIQGLNISIRITNTIVGPAFYGKDDRYKVPVSIYYKTYS